MSQGGDGLDVSVVFGRRDVLARDVNAWWTQWNTARNAQLDRWSELLRYAYATSTRDTSNESVTSWSNTTHRPKIANLFDTLTINYDSALFPNDDWLRWEGGDQEAATMEQRDIIEAYMKTKHRLRYSGFRDTMRQLEADWVLFGNAFASVDYTREFSTDLLGVQTPGYVGPKIFRIDPRDIVFNPQATSFAQSPKIIRYLYSIADLERIVQERPDMPHFQGILDTAKSHRGRIRQFNQSDLDKDLLLQFDGFGTATQYFNSGLVEVLEFYGDLWVEDSPASSGPDTAGDFKKNHVITVVDRWVAVRDEPVVTRTGRPHMFHVGWRQRPGNLWGQGPLDNLVGMQYRIDHLENARADAFDQMLDPDVVIAGDIEEIVQIGGAKNYYIAESGSIAYLRPDTTVLQADLQIRELTDSMETFALAPKEALGFRSPGEKTAFEVDKLTTAASRSFQHKAEIFQEFLEEIVNAELEVAVQNLDAVDVIEVTDNDHGAAEFRKITKADITSNGRLVPVGARHFARNAQLVQNLTQLQAGPLADPEVAQHVSSIGLAQLYQELLDVSGAGKTLVQPFVRVAERAQAASLTNAAQDQVQQEALTNTAEAGELDGDGGSEAGPEGAGV